MVIMLLYYVLFFVLFCLIVYKFTADLIVAMLKFNKQRLQLTRLNLTVRYVVVCS